MGFRIEGSICRLLSCRAEHFCDYVFREGEGPLQLRCGCFLVALTFRSHQRCVLSSWLCAPSRAGSGLRRRGGIQLLFPRCGPSVVPFLLQIPPCARFAQSLIPAPPPRLFSVRENAPPTPEAHSALRHLSCPFVVSCAAKGACDLN